MCVYLFVFLSIVDFIFLSGSGVKENITSYIEHEDVSSSQNATSPVTNSGIIGVDSLTYNLGNGDAYVCFISVSS